MALLLALVLRVCADPNNMPFSNRAGEGFENAMARMMARELGADERAVARALRVIVEELEASEPRRPAG